MSLPWQQEIRKNLDHARKFQSNYWLVRYQEDLERTLSEYDKLVMEHEHLKLDYEKVCRDFDDHRREQDEVT